MTSPGWYDDPQGSDNLRYWDGHSWTEHLHNRAVPLEGSASAGVPPFQAAAGSGAAPAASSAPAPSSAPGSLFSNKAITGWANGTVAVLTGYYKELAILSFLIPFPFFIVTYIFIDQAFRGAQWSDLTGDIEGIKVSMIGLAAVSALITMVVVVASWTATSHYAHEAFVGRPPASWADSLRAVAPRVPKSFGLGLMVAGVIYVAFGLPIALMIYGIASERLGFLAFGLAIPFMLIFIAWFLAKVAFIQVSVAVVPSGTSALATSWGLGRGRFWPMFGRLAIIYALSAMVGTVTQIISQTLAPLILFSGVEIRDGGVAPEILIDGQRIETLDIVSFGDLLPNPLMVVIFLAMAGLAQALNLAVVGTAIAGLYSEMGGPSRSAD